MEDIFLDSFGRWVLDLGGEGGDDVGDGEEEEEEGAE